MEKISHSSPSISKDVKDDSSIEDYEDTLLDVSELYALSRGPLSSTPLNASTPCLTESRPSSSVGTGCEWENPWTPPSMANSDSCLVSSSSGTSPLTGTSSQGVSPDGTNNVFSFQNDQDKIPDGILPSIGDALQTEKDFMEYVMSFPLSASDIHRGCWSDSKKNFNDSSPKVGLDHLDNLCKLMEQLSDLKEANVKLKRRVQYLEDLKTLHEIHREMLGSSIKCHSSPSDDELQIKTQKAIKVSPKRGRSVEKSPDLKRTKDEETRGFVSGLYRSKTTTHVDTRTEQKRECGHRSRNDGKVKARERSKSVGHPGHSKCKKRSSRWSKVKEVLGIEKTDSRTNDEQFDDSDEKLIDEDSMHEMSEHHLRRSNSKRSNGKDSSKRSRSSNNLSKNEESFHSKKTNSSECHNKPVKAVSQMEQYEQGGKKSPKTPWGRMKTMMQSRKGNQKSESSSSSCRGNCQEKHQSEEHDEQSDNRRISRTRKSSFTLQDVPKRHLHEADHNDDSESQSLNIEKSSSRQNLRRRPEEDSKSTSSRHRSTNQSSSQIFKEKTPEKPQKNNKDSTKRRSSIEQNSLNNKEEMKSKLNLSEAIQKKLSQPDKGQCGEATHATSETKIKNTEKNQKDSTNVPSTATITELLKELQENLSEDFNRKMEEWQKYRGETIKSSNLDVERKDSFARFRKFSKPDKKEKTTPDRSNTQKKDLNWLDKEIPKVEREILRLSKEKQKFEKRSFRLKHLKEAMTESKDGQEVLVRTAAGEFRFEGISNAFTKKLYEWETKKGVGPELSTIALLDESLNPQESKLQSRECISISDIDTRSLISSCDQNERLPYQISKASSEPDLSTLLSNVQKESGGTLTPFRSKSGDNILSNSNCKDSEMVHSKTDLKIVNCENKENEILNKGSTSFMDKDDSYCSLLEENMFLLDQLKEKEGICSKLQNELDRLDVKCDYATRAHQEELETYKQKLWEIHMSRPRDLQGSLQLISQLKTRIEELEKCSDKLKCDREKLEESFKFHSEQQSRLTDGLMRRLLEMQESRLPDIFNRTGCRRKWRKLLKCDAVSVAKIHELSTKLLHQARDMEVTLAERTKQVCHLRWELLHRDMSAVLLQAALHRVTCQGPQAALLPTWNMKRIQFKELKAWSIDTTTRRQSENTIAEDWLQERLKQLSVVPYNEWTSVEFNPNDLMDTAHELKKETFKMSTCRSARLSDSEDRKKASCSAESENADSDRNYDTGSAFNSRSSSFSSGPGYGLRGSHSDTRLYERSRSVSIHRNSSSSMSCVSGFDASESSSMHDSDKIHQQFLRRGATWNRKRRNRWSSRENVSSSCSSHSSGLEDENAAQWDHEKGDINDFEEAMSRHLKYESLREADEENAELMDTFSSTNTHCFSRPNTSTACSMEFSSRSNGPTYTLLKSLISHPSYSRTITSTFATDSNDLELGRRYAGFPDSSSDPSSLLDANLQDGNGGAVSYNSSAYTSAESLESCNYVTHKEQQLFLDIRNLAISCEQDLATAVVEFPESVADEEDTQETEHPAMAARPLTPECKLSTISQVKYKGTKGFGRPYKLDYRKYEDSFQNAVITTNVTSCESSKDSDPKSINKQ